MTKSEAIKLLENVKEGNSKATRTQITIALMKTGDLIVPTLKLEQLQKEQSWSSFVPQS